MITSQSFQVLFFLLSALFYQSPFPEYLMQAGTPVITQNFISHEDGCNWMGVAGQIFGMDGLPSNGRLIEVHGYLEGEPVYLASTSGSSVQMGPGGYDIQISDTPIETQGDLYLLLVDPGGTALTRKLYFNTGGACNQNLTIINLIEFPVVMELFFPNIVHNK